MILWKNLQQIFRQRFERDQTERLGIRAVDQRICARHDAGEAQPIIDRAEQADVRAVGYAVGERRAIGTVAQQDQSDRHPLADALDRVDHRRPAFLGMVAADAEQQFCLRRQSALLEQRSRDPLFVSGAVRLSGGALSFVYKAAAEIGELGDNTRTIREAIDNDALLRLALASPTSSVAVLGHTRWASVGIISEPNAHPLNHEEDGLTADRPYVVAVLTTAAKLPFWVALPLAAVAAGATGALLALPALRVKGPYLAMVTIASPYAIWVLKQASDKLPVELDEVADHFDVTEEQLRGALRGITPDTSVSVQVRRDGQVVTKRLAEDQLFGAQDILGSNAIEVYVHRLRQKLEAAGSQADIITVRGVGYLIKRRS